MNKKISIIGGGNLGGAIAEGLAKSKTYLVETLTVCDLDLNKIVYLRDMGVTTTSDLKVALHDSGTVIVAVKPWHVEDLLREIAPYLSQEQRLVSVVAGLDLSRIKEIVGDRVKVFRAMPNTAMAIQLSMTELCTTLEDGIDKTYILDLFNLLGEAMYIPENLFNAATVLGASGTAFAMRFMRACILAGIEMGFTAKDAKKITAQMVKGAAMLLQEKDGSPEDEIDRVSTPKGVTITGLNEMEHNGFSSAVIKGILAGYNKI